MSQQVHGQGAQSEPAYGAGHARRSAQERSTGARAWKRRGRERVANLPRPGCVAQAHEKNTACGAGMTVVVGVRNGTSRELIPRWLGARRGTSVANGDVRLGGIRAGRPPRQRVPYVVLHSRRAADLSASVGPRAKEDGELEVNVGKDERRPRPTY